MKTQQQSSAQKENPGIKVQNHGDFLGRDLYIGIDVHKDRWQVAVYHEGLILSNSGYRRQQFSSSSPPAQALWRSLLPLRL
jgi:hypothetical protein